MGAVIYAGVMKDKERNQSKGCGIVEFEAEDQAQKAIQQFNGYEVGCAQPVVPTMHHNPTLAGLGLGGSRRVAVAESCNTCCGGGIERQRTMHGRPSKGRAWDWSVGWAQQCAVCR